MTYRVNWDKPIQTYGGLKARILERDHKLAGKGRGVDFFLIAITQPNGRETTCLHMKDGKTYNDRTEENLINTEDAPQEPECKPDCPICRGTSMVELAEPDEFGFTHTWCPILSGRFTRLDIQKANVIYHTEEGEDNAATE